LRTFKSSKPEKFVSININSELVFRLNLEAFLGLPLFNSQDLFGTAVSNNEFFCVSQDDPVSWDPLATVIAGRDKNVLFPLSFMGRVDVGDVTIVENRLCFEC
jgi:hypothetical protein